MKNRFLKGALAPVVVLTTLSFTTVKKEINTQESLVTWKGKKIAGSHEGNIQLQNGFISLDDEGRLVGGEFVMDMNTIVVTDLEGENKEKLEGHLNSDDFFGVQDHSESRLLITDVAAAGNGKYVVTGDLTIKGTTNPVSFDMEVQDHSASAKLKIDRTKFGIRYGSGSFFDNLGDNAIHNNFELDVNLKF